VIDNKPPREHVDANKLTKEPLYYKKLATYDLVFKTLNKVANTTKGEIDNKAPQTMNLNKLFLQ